MKFNTYFKLTLSLGFVFLLTGKINAQANPAYKANQEGWLTSLDEAYTKSKKLNKPIMANFTGSDWCGWCHRLSAAVFVKEDFKKWATKNVILLELDFPRRKALPAEIQSQNASLQQAFQVTGYPTIWVFDLDRDPKTKQYSIKALGKTGYVPTLQEFTSGVDQMIARRSKV